MKFFIIILVLSSSLIFPQNAKFNSSQMEKEYEIRFGNGKKTRGGGLSKSDKDKYFKSEKKTTKKYKKLRGFPLPPLPPIEDSKEDTPPTPDNPEDTNDITDNVTEDEDNSKVRDNILTDYEGKYQIIDDSEGSKTVKFLENVAIRVHGKILKLMIDPGYNYHAAFNSEGKLTSNYAHLMEPVKMKVGNNEVEVSGWVSFNDKGGINFLCPAGDNIKFNIGNNTVTYNYTSKSGYLQKIFFYEDGSVESIHIRDPHAISVGNRKIKFDHHEGCGGDLDFYRSGNLKGGYLADSTSFNGINLPKTSFVKFYESGNIQEIGFPGTKNIKGYSVKSNDEYWPTVEFYENGNIKQIKALAKRTKIEGKFYNKGKILVFKEDGSLDYAY